MKFISKKHLNDRGYTLVIVLLVLFIISIGGISLLTVTANTTKIVTNERDSQSAYYIAESALTETKAKIDDAANSIAEKIKNEYSDNLKKNVADRKSVEFFQNRYLQLFKNEIENIKNNSTSIEFEEYFGTKPIANVMLNYIEKDNEIDISIQSTGKIKEKTRTLSQNVLYGISGLVEVETSENNFTYTPEYPIHALGQIEVSNGNVNVKIKMATALSKSQNNKNKNKGCSENICIFDEEFPNINDFINELKKQENVVINPDDNKFMRETVDDIIVVDSGSKIQLKKDTVINGMIIAPNSEIFFNGNGNSKITINGFILAKSVKILNGEITGNSNPQQIIIGPKEDSPSEEIDFDQIKAKINSHSVIEQ